MDTSELLEMGARSKVVSLCKQMEELVTLVPTLKRFAKDLMRESLGPIGKGGARVKGSGAARLTAELIEARKKRGSVRPPMSAAQRAAMSRIAKKRWAAAKKAGLPPGTKLPTNAALQAAASKNGKASAEA